tara:strand:- start:302 stop:637 length:336 start_codon:yes stop_codon:yes gene_type:complete
LYCKNCTNSNGIIFLNNISNYNSYDFINECKNKLNNDDILYIYTNIIKLNNGFEKFVVNYEDNRKKIYIDMYQSDKILKLKNTQVYKYLLTCKECKKYLISKFNFKINLFP